MKLKRLILLLAASAQTVSTALAQPESMASIFSNANKHAEAAAVPLRPSIIVIACDGLGLGDLSCYGQTNFQTPNLDRLASEGARFVNYRVAGEELPKVQAALMQGTGAAGQPTLAERLKQAGYRTGLFGEWLLGTQPWTQGFDEFAGFVDERNARDYFPQAMERHMANGGYAGREAIHDNAGGQKKRYSVDILMSAAANFIRINTPDPANHFRPFFLLVNLPAPHSAAEGKDDFPVPTDAPYSGEPWPQPAKNRAALMGRVDEGVGRVLEELNKRGLTNNVAVFFTAAAAPPKFASTNLNFLKAPGEVRGGNSPERLRVPMLVRWPEHVAAGQVNKEPWHDVDFAPTALQIAHAKTPAGYSGVSMLPELLGEMKTNSPTGPEKKQH
jgi:arylsulfatase A-like enzyme